MTARLRLLCFPAASHRVCLSTPPTPHSLAIGATQQRRWIVSRHAPVSLSVQPLHSLILDAIRRYIREQPGKIANISAENTSSVTTFKEVHDAILSSGSFLKSRGFKKGSVLGISLHNCWQYNAFFLGASLNGGMHTGIGSLATPLEIERQFKDANVSIVFTNEKLLPKIQQAVKALPKIKTIVVLGKNRPSGEGLFSWDEVTNTPHSDFDDVKIDARKDIVHLPYSSGTTGVPKSVMLTHHNFTSALQIVIPHELRNYASFKPPFDVSKEKALFFMPMANVYGCFLLNLYLLHGQTAIVMTRFDLDLFFKTIQDYKVRLAYMVPPILVQLSKSETARKYDLSSLQVILSGAAPVGKDLGEAVKQRLPSVKIMQGWGMTETCGLGCLPDYSVREQPIESVGYVAQNHEMRILDVTTGAECARGMPGEVVLRGPSVFAGYLKREQATKETLRDGWLHTGDIGYVDNEDYVYIIDRIKELIKVKGYQVPPAELEDVLLHEPRIRDVAVIGVPHAEFGEVPKAFVVKKPGCQLTQNDINEFVNARVSKYKRLLGGIEFVSEIPKSPAGKILRRVLKDMQANASKQ